MLNIILIDDDEYVLNKMQTAFDWETWGYFVSGVFKDAKPVMDYVEKNHVDVVLTDIKLPIMDGLELAKVMAQKHPEIRVVILSAYNDFSYAQQAIKYRVFRYLLKPLNFVEFKDTFVTLAEEMNNDDEEVGKPIIKRRLLNEIEVGIANLESGIECEIAEAGLPVNVAFLPVAIVNLIIKDDNSAIEKYGEEAFINLIEQIMNSVTKKYSIVVHRINGKTVVLWAFSLEEIQCSNFETEIRNTFPGILDVLRETSKIRAEFNSVRVYNNISSIDSFLYDGYSDTINDFSTEFVTCLNQDDLKSAYKIFEKFKILCSKTDTDEAVLKCKLFVEKVSEGLKMSGNDFTLSYDKKTLEKSFDAFINRIMYGFGDKKNDESDFVTSALKYVDEHYMDDISLESVAKYVYVSPKYFSTVFKKKVGISFSEYLLGRRIQKAVYYLSKSEYKMYEIGEMIGYKSERQFFRVFKKYTGCTPSEYRDKLL